MVTIKVKLNGINDIKSFCNKASAQSFDIDVVSGRYIVDAKSIMGMFSLDLSRPVEVTIQAEKSECESFLTEIDDLIVK